MKYITFRKESVMEFVSWTGISLKHKDVAEALGVEDHLLGAGFCDPVKGVCFGESTSLKMTPSLLDEDLMAMSFIIHKAPDQDD